MRTFFAAAIMVSALATPAFAEDGTFHNILLESPSIVSPSQIYQVDPKGLVEASVGIADGSSDPKEAGAANEDIKATVFAVGGAFVPASDWVLNLDIRNEDSEEGEGEVKVTEFRPAVAYTFHGMFTLGVSANMFQAKFKIPGYSNDFDWTTTTIGVTAHQNDWEGTLAYTTKHDDDELSVPSEFALHGRYRLNGALALGLSLKQRDWSSVGDDEADGEEEDEDETAFGLHAEAKIADNFSMEFAFLSTQNSDGEKGDDASEFIVIGAAEVAPRLEVGGRLAYETESGDFADRTVVKPGLFVSAGF